MSAPNRYGELGQVYAEMQAEIVALRDETFSLRKQLDFARTTKQLDLEQIHRLHDLLRDVRDYLEPLEADAPDSLSALVERIRAELGKK